MHWMGDSGLSNCSNQFTYHNNHITTIAMYDWNLQNWKWRICKQHIYCYTGFMKMFKDSFFSWVQTGSVYLIVEPLHFGQRYGEWKFLGFLTQNIPQKSHTSIWLLTNSATNVSYCSVCPCKDETSLKCDLHIQYV